MNATPAVSSVEISPLAGEANAATAALSTRPTEATPSTALFTHTSITTSDTVVALSNGL
ncbi:hypothetical protein [Streptomyces sp. P3]|uniref:hypothetical protein n=1 Tax=Streptomyces sp. P3 TaxID=2135430 RepID=UPI00131EFAA3|nr:hypothetical protein [Streptomyces sp. P3]